MRLITDGVRNERLRIDYWQCRVLSYSADALSKTPIKWLAPAALPSYVTTPIPPAINDYLGLTDS